MNSDDVIEEELAAFREDMKEGRLEAFTHKPVASTAVILRRDRYIAALPTADGWGVDLTGRYLVEAQTRYWNNYPIPRGWVSVYVEGDPEAVSEREPVGFSAMHVERHLGGYLSSIVQGAFKAKSGFELKPWMAVAALVGLVIVAGYLIWQQRTGV